MKYGTVPGLQGEVTRLVQGSVMLRPESKDEGFAILDAVYDAGIRAMDSSHIYGGGGCDRVIGEWMKSRGVRSEFVLMDKCCHPVDGVNRVTPEHIASDLESCLRNLQFDYLDILTFHRDDPNTPIAELVQAMNEHISAGRIGAYGCSNWSIERFREAQSYAERNGYVPFALSSPHFSLAVCYDPPWEGCRSITGVEGRAAYEAYLADQVPLFCWSSLSSGFFSGRYTRDNAGEQTEGQPALVARCYAREDNFRRLDRVKVLAGRFGASTSQIALAYVLSSPQNAFPLIACWRPEEAFDNVKACDIDLDEDEMAWLDLRREELPE
jgi:aryl-alcohol dehydrogenase-like predicted oxidoreductase